jgi:hypothetical protein
MRCTDTDVDGGRCQLVLDHDGPHAANIDGAYVTWSADEIYHWRRRTPPHWVAEMPWAPGLPPPTEASRAG